jgi:hypothetical protein
MAVLAKASSKLLLCPRLLHPETGKPHAMVKREHVVWRGIQQDGGIVVIGEKLESSGGSSIHLYFPGERLKKSKQFGTHLKQEIIHTTQKAGRQAGRQVGRQVPWSCYFKILSLPCN